MAKQSTNSYSQNTTFILVIVAAIVFACLGYWYGSTNPGGFSSLSIQNIGNVLSGMPRDHPGIIGSDKATMEGTYDNSRIGLSFSTPPGYNIHDFWPGDSTDLMITASSYEYLSVINTQNKFPTFDQMQISEFETLGQFNFMSLPNVNNMEDFIAKYSVDSVDANSQTQKPYFTNPEKVNIGNLEGYKATLSPDYAYGSEAGTIYFVNNNGHYFSLIFRDSKGSTELQNKVFETIKFS